jgi:uncharacterized membrane protein
VNEALDRTLVVFEAGRDWPAWALAGLAAVLLIVLGVRSVQNLSRARSATLIVLRILLALLVVLLALRPLLRTERLSVSSAPVAVVVDSSGSMGVRDQVGGESRLAGVSEWVRQHESALDDFESEAVVDWFLSADGVLRATTRAEIAAGGLTGSGGTDLAGVLEALGDRYAGRARPGLLLLSDGADRGRLGEAFAAGRGVARFLEPPGGAIVSVVPEDGGFSDLALDLEAHDPVGFLRTEMTVRVRVRSSGLPPADVPVTLLSGNSVVQVKSVRVGGDDGSEQLVVFTLEPVQTGEALYRVEVPIRAGEAVATNNEATFSVRVVRDRIRVLQVVGRPSWDGRFLRELLKRDPAIDLISFFILRSTWDDPVADVDELSLIPFPVDELFDEKLDGFDLVIFQNFTFRPYGIQRHLGSVRDHVRDRGGGLLVIGGDLAFGGDYRGPEIAEVLPATVERTQRWSGDSIQVAATPSGLRHPILRLGGGRPAVGQEASSRLSSLVDELLPVEGLNVGLSPSADAQVLLESADAEHRPVLIAAERGQGRSLQLATDGSWRWSLPMAGQGKSPRAYERFWENAIRWLVRDPRSELVLLDSDRRSVGPGESAEMRVHVRSESYEVEPGVRVTLSVRDATGKLVREETGQTGEDGTLSVPLAPELPGLYAVEASTSRGSAGPVYLERLDAGRELADASVNPELLRALASASGGSVRRLDEGFPRLPFARSRDVRVESASVRPLWRTWWAWSLVAGLFSLEWWLRRRWGLA